MSKLGEHVQSPVRIELCHNLRTPPGIRIPSTRDRSAKGHHACQGCATQLNYRRPPFDRSKEFRLVQFLVLSSLAESVASRTSKTIACCSCAFFNARCSAIGGFLAEQLPKQLVDRYILLKSAEINAGIYERMLAGFFALHNVQGHSIFHMVNGLRPCLPSHNPTKYLPGLRRTSCKRKRARAFCPARRLTDSFFCAVFASITRNPFLS